VGKTGFHRSSGATAFVEWSSAVHNKTSEIGVSDAPTDRSDLRRLNPPNDLSPAMTLAGMRRLIDSDRSPASSLLVSHPCSSTRGRSVGVFSSVRRAGRLRIVNGHARNRASDIHQGPLGRRGTNLQASSTGVQDRPVMCLQPPEPAFSDPERVRSRSTRCCGSARRDVCSHPVWTAPTGNSPWECPGSKQGPPWVPGNTEGPPGSSGKGDVMIHRPCLVAWPAGSDWRTRRPSRAFH
jgi:hypothetical protein